MDRKTEKRTVDILQNITASQKSQNYDQFNFGFQNVALHTNSTF